MLGALAEGSARLLSAASADVAGARPTGRGRGRCENPARILPGARSGLGPDAPVPVPSAPTAPAAAETRP